MRVTVARVSNNVGYTCATVDPHVAQAEQPSQLSVKELIVALSECYDNAVGANRPAWTAPELADLAQHSHQLVG